MDLLLSTSALALTTIAYGTATGMTLFDSQYKIEDKGKNNNSVTVIVESARRINILCL